MRRPEEILHDLACEADRFLDHAAAMHVRAQNSALEDLITEAAAFKLNHVPADCAFSHQNNERKDDL
jgi:hypothetical protein